MRVAVHKTVNRSPAVRPAAAAHVQPATQTARASDPAEREAEATARNVIRMPLPASAVARVQRNAAADPGGQALPPDVRTFMEPRFRADFSAVRVHTGPQAAQLNRQLNARAFTVGRDIYFGEGRFQPDTEAGRELIAHELTHTLQQDAGPVKVQRLGLDDVVDALAALAANVPGFTLLTLIIGRNPINLRVVERNATNLLRAFMGLVPGGELLFQVLERYGVVRRLGEWIGERSEALGLNFASIREAFTRFTDSLGWRDIFSPGDVWRRADAIFSPYLARIRGLAVGLATQALAWLKERFMQPLADFCREIPGYSLVTVQLGRDPFTNSPVARTAMNVVRAVAEFIPSGREKVDQLAQSGALERAYRWFMDETRARNLTWERISGTFVEAWNALRLEDVLHPIDTLRRMVNLFRPLLADLASFARAALMKLAEFVFEAAMGAAGARIVAIFRAARGAFNLIIADPVRFLRNLLGAVGQGIRQFMANILAHLRDGVIAWLAGPVARAGIQTPERWDLRGIIWFVLQILGLTWARVRGKLVRLMGERAVAMLEAGFQLIQEIREKGLVQALRDRVTEFFGSLREAALGAIRSFIQQRLVMAGIQQLLSMLTPVGAVIQAIIKIYNTVQFFLAKIDQILELVESIVNSIAAIASGAIAAAANFVERTMARTIPLVLDFLARFIGLGDVGAQVQRTLQGLQARVDQMLDRAVDWIRQQAARLAGAARRAVGRLVEWWKERQTFSVEGRPHTLYFEGEKDSSRLFVESSPGRPISEYLKDLPPTAKKKPEYTEARDLADKLEDRRPASVSEEEHSEKKIGWYKKLAPLLKTLWEDEDRPLSIVTFGPLQAGVGATKMEAKILTRKHEEGTPVSDSWPLWEALEPMHDKTGPPNYVLGHLLNRELGGKGNMFNLTPITKKANAEHSSQVEEHVKSWVKKGRVVYYKVTADYGGRSKDKGDRERLLEARTNLTKPARDELAALQAERSLVRTLTINAYVQKFEKGEWVEDDKAKEGPFKNKPVENRSSAGY